MGRIIKASAYANNEVGFLAWSTDGLIEGCLGFEIFREYLDDAGRVTERVPLAAYVGFKGQSNPDWKAQNTSLWPVQKFTWRDLTLRKRRDQAERRPDEVRLRYTVRAVGDLRDGLEPVVPRQEGTAPNYNTYEGRPRPLGYLGAAVRSNAVTITRSRPPFTTTFTNGILSGQWLTRALTADDGRIEDGELKAHLLQPGDAIRDYLAGDVPGLFREFFDQPGGRFHLALYELDDAELEQLILDNAERIDLILANTGQQKDEEDGEGKIWDGRNHPARKRLMERAAKRGTKFRLHHRMFNNSAHIGHNKFAVRLDGGGAPRSVLTGSTNWTWSGLAGQSNNAVRIDDANVAAAFDGYWQRLLEDNDGLELPEPLTDPSKNVQGPDLRQADTTPAVATLSGATAELWFSPNTRQKTKPSKNPACPPDLARVFELLDQAQKAVLFLVFYPSNQGRDSIVDKAVQCGLAKKDLLVLGAVSDPKAMVNFQSKAESASGKDEKPFTYTRNGISIVRAAALTDKAILKILRFQAEMLKVGQAIIHDKVLVIDPLDPDTCTVVFGSHNLGYKASYCNDENLVIVRGHPELAQAYAVHVLDVYDHYRFRARESDLKVQGKEGWDGFLATTDAWQKKASKRIAAYFAGQ